MQIIDVNSVKEAYGALEANKLLEQGWKLITVVAATNPKGPAGVLIPCYVFGNLASQN
jgi:hypothetical protein